MTMPERYRGRPILVIIENYVLAVIGELSAETFAGMLGIVQHVWAGGDDWMATVRVQLDWKEMVNEDIRKNWIGYQEAARKQGKAASPVKFAMSFADAVEKLSSTPN